MFDNLLAKVESAKTDENEKKVNELSDMIKKSKHDITEKIKSPKI